MKTITYDDSKWKLVPIEATNEMKRAGIAKYEFAMRVGAPEYDVMDAIDMAYDAMLEIAPTVEI